MRWSSLVVALCLGCGSERPSTSASDASKIDSKGDDMSIADSSIVDETGVDVVDSSSSPPLDSSGDTTVASDTKPTCSPWDGGTVCGGNACGKAPDGCGGTTECGCTCRLYESCGVPIANHCGGCKLAPLKEPCTVGGKSGRALACAGGYAPKFSPCTLMSSGPDGDGGTDYFYCCDAAVTSGTSPC